MTAGKKIWLLTLLTFLLLLIIMAPVYAVTTEEIETRQQELEEIEKRRRDEKSALDHRLNREAALKEELLQIEYRLHELRLEQERLAAEISTVENEIAETAEKLAQAEEELNYQENLLKLRLRAIQQHGFVTYIEVLFESQSFADFLTRLHDLSIIAGNDLRLVDEIQAERDRIQAMKESLEQKKADLEDMHRQVAANEAEMERVVEERSYMIAALQEEIGHNLKAIADLENEAQELDALIRQLIAEASSRFSGVQGDMHWPIEPPARISSGYGWRRDPFSGNQAWHGAIDIAPYNAAANYILAAAEGEVIFTGWNGGYGNCIMIDHGDGTVTLYAHMSSLLVPKGEIVHRGQRIGRAGTTGYSTGVHLHFEVREYNKPAVRSFSSGVPDHRYNPMNYF